MRKTRLAVAAAAAVAATVAMSPAANANTAERYDARDDAPRHIDLTRAVIDNGDTDPELAIIRFRVDGTLRAGDHMAVWFNTDPSDADPELRLSSYVDSEYALRSIQTWHDQGEDADCEEFAMKQFTENHGVKVRIDRDCLDNRPVRVAIRTMSDDGHIDWFQGRRTFLPGVRH